ncbi:MAG: hypothetical protein PVI26_01635 [Chitinispirillia bacterium]|jgi:hypothetical protein
MNIVYINVFTSFLWVTAICAFSQANHYLWIEFDKGEKKKDGAITLPLYIHFGQFPNQRIRNWELDSLKVYYTRVQQKIREKRNFYELPIEIHDGVYQVSITSFKSNRYIVFVRGIKKYNGITHYYYAKTSCVIFGKAFSMKNKNGRIKSHSIEKTLEIFRNPEFDYWPQTGSPIIISSCFKGKMLPNKTLEIFDQHLDYCKVKTDRNGNVTYTPPHDITLNRKGVNAFKHSIFIVRESSEKENHIFSFTQLLHRSRFAQKHENTGLIVFGVTCAFMLFLVVFKRRSFAV